VTNDARRLNRIHLLHNTPYEKDNLDPLAPVAERHGYEVRYSTTKVEGEEPFEIGIYCGHAEEPDFSGTDPTAARLSVVMLHDLGQSMWPSRMTAEKNHWTREPWEGFDIGILPGPSWSEAWHRFSATPGARPRLGVFELGYPKADRIFSDPDGVAGDVQRLRERLGLGPRPTILLVPSWESAEHNRCDGFLSALRGLGLNLLVKYQAGMEDVARETVERYAGVGDDIFFIEVATDITACLALADVVVSDESNCLVEATLFDVPGVGVLDWEVPAVPSWGTKPRPPSPPEHVERVTSDQLRVAVERTLSDLPRYRAEARQVRDETFTNLGSSAEAIISLIDSIQASPG
jgi:hypothetical protein